MPFLLAKLAGMPRLGQWIIVGSLLLLLGASLAVATVQTVRIDGFLWIDGLSDKLAARDKTIADMAAASEEAARAQKRVNQQWKSEVADYARRTDAAVAEARELRGEIGRLRAAADTFHDARGLRKICGGASGQAGAPAQDPVAPLDGGAGHDMVVLTKPEYDIAVGNTLRLWSIVNRYALPLVHDGKAEVVGDPEPIATPEPAFGQE